MERMDDAAEWTIHVEGFKLTAPSPALKQWSVDEVRTELAGLVKDGLLKQDTADTAVESETVWKVKVGALGKLLKLGGEIEERLNRARHPSTKTRSVTVTSKAVKATPK